MRRFALLPVLLATFLGAPPAHAWTWPVDGPVLRPFLFGHDPYAAGLHRGIDIGAAPGTAVRAPRDGLVRFAGTVPGNGRTVTIETADGYSVTVLHLGAFTVARGSLVAEGDTIAVVGPSDGLEHEVPSVHLGVRVTADPHGYVDPLPLLPNGTPLAPVVSEPEAPGEAGPSVPEAPSEAPEASEPEPPTVQEPTSEPPLPLVAPVGSVPDLAHAPAVETAPAPPRVEAPPPSATPVAPARATRVVEIPPPAHSAAAGTASAGVPKDEAVATDTATPSSLRSRANDPSAPAAKPVHTSAGRDEPRGLPWRPPAVALATLLAVLLVRRRQLVRRGAALGVRPSVQAGRQPRDRSTSTESAPATAELVESCRPTELEPQCDARAERSRRSWVRPDPDRGGPRPRRGRHAAQGRSARQPTAVVGARRRR